MGNSNWKDTIEPVRQIKQNQAIKCSWAHRNNPTDRRVGQIKQSGAGEHTAVGRLALSGHRAGWAIRQIRRTGQLEEELDYMKACKNKKTHFATVLTLPGWKLQASGVLPDCHMARLGLHSGQSGNDVPDCRKPLRQGDCLAQECSCHTIYAENPSGLRPGVE